DARWAVNDSSPDCGPIGKSFVTVGTDASASSGKLVVEILYDGAEIAKACESSEVSQKIGATLSFNVVAKTQQSLSSVAVEANVKKWFPEHSSVSTSMS